MYCTGNFTHKTRKCFVNNILSVTSKIGYSDFRKMSPIHELNYIKHTRTVLVPFCDKVDIFGILKDYKLTNTTLISFRFASSIG